MRGPRSIGGRRVAALIAVLAGPPTSAASQTSISGIAIDSTNTPISLVQVSTGGSTVLTDAGGRFAVIAPASDTATLVFRRVGYRQREIQIALSDTGQRINVGRVTLTAFPVPIDNISVQALQPVLTARGIREYEFARRMGIRRHFLTAYDIERYKPFDIGDLSRRVPGVRTVEDNTFGRAIQIQNRNGLWCTATIIVDGIASRNTNPELLATTERIGAMWYTAADCTLRIWTKPVPSGAVSSFEIGARVSGSPAGGENHAGVGAYMAVPMIADWAVFYPAADPVTGRPDIRWQIQIAVVIPGRVIHPALYIGGGGRFRKLESRDPNRPSFLPIVVLGTGKSWGPARIFVETVLAGPGTPEHRRLELVLGVGYRHLAY